jgi:hypothetical protein
MLNTHELDIQDRSKYINIIVSAIIGAAIMFLAQDVTEWFMGVDFENPSATSSDIPSGIVTLLGRMLPFAKWIGGVLVVFAILIGVGKLQFVGKGQCGQIRLTPHEQDTPKVLFFAVHRCHAAINGSYFVFLFSPARPILADGSALWLVAFGFFTGRAKHTNEATPHTKARDQRNIPRIVLKVRARVCLHGPVSLRGVRGGLFASSFYSRS